MKKSSLHAVLHLSSIRTLLPFAAKKKLHVHQMDVVSAFLNGDLKEEIYVKQPPGYKFSLQTKKIHQWLEAVSTLLESKAL